MDQIEFAVMPTSESSNLKKIKAAPIPKIREYVCKSLMESEQCLSAQKVEAFLKKPIDERVNALIAIGMEMQISFLNYRESYQNPFRQRYQFKFIFTEKMSKRIRKQDFNSFGKLCLKRFKGEDVIGTLNYTEKQIFGLFLMDSASYQKIQEI